MTAPRMTAVVLQAVGLASLREASRAARSVAAVAPRWGRVVVGDAATLARAPADAFTRALDVEGVVDAATARALRRVARGARDEGCRRRVGCATRAVRALRTARTPSS